MSYERVLGVLSKLLSIEFREIPSQLRAYMRAVRVCA